jgi:hypothetical protein
MKIDRYGQAKILTPEEIQILFREGLTTPRDRVLTLGSGLRHLSLWSVSNPRSL